jgi:hypothetical protein
MKQYKRYTRKNKSNKKIHAKKHARKYTRKYRGGDAQGDEIEKIKNEIDANFERSKNAATDSEKLLEEYTKKIPNPDVPPSSSQNNSLRPENISQEQNNPSLASSDSTSNPSLASSDSTSNPSLASSDSTSNPSTASSDSTSNPSTASSDSTLLSENARKVAEKTTIKLMVFPKLNHNEKDKTKKPGDFVIIKKDEDVYNEPASGFDNTEIQEKTIVVPRNVFTKIEKDLGSTDDLLKVLKDGIPKRNPAVMQVITITDDTSKKELKNELDKERSSIQNNQPASQKVKGPGPTLVSQINK